MQGEPVEALSQMAQKKHKIMNIEEGDSVFLAITASANMEVIIADTLNELVRAGAHIIPNNKKSMLQVMVVWKIKNDVKYNET